MPDASLWLAPHRKLYQRDPNEHRTSPSSQRRYEAMEGCQPTGKLAACIFGGVQLLPPSDGHHYSAIYIALIISITTICAALPYRLLGYRTSPCSHS